MKSIYLIIGVFFWKWDIPLRSRIEILNEISPKEDGVNVSIFNGILLYDNDIFEDLGTGILWEKNKDGSFVKESLIDRLEITDNKISFLKGDNNGGSDCFKIDLSKTYNNIWEGSWIRCYKDSVPTAEQDFPDRKGLIRCFVNKAESEFFVSLTEADIRKKMESDINYSYDDYIKLSQEEKQRIFSVVNYLYEPFAKNFFKEFPDKDWLIITVNPFVNVTSANDILPYSTEGLDRLSKHKNKPVFLFSRWPIK